MSEKLPELPDQEIFALTDIDHELIEKFQPQFIARGGEHVVYDIQDHPNIVAKANVESVTHIIRENISKGKSADYFGEDNKSRAETYLQREHRRYKQLQEFFGKEHTLAQKKYVLKVPVTPQILNDIFEGNPPAALHEAWAIVSIQKRSKALEDPEHLTVVSGYAEKHDIDPDEYKNQTDQLFTHPEGTELDLEAFMSVQSNHSLNEAIGRILHDSQLQPVMRDFVEKAIRYTTETGETLDLAGTDNVAIYEQEGTWNYELMDALYPGNDTMVNATREGIKKLARGEKPTRNEMSSVMNTINYVRVINGLAKYLGISKRIDIVPTESKEADIDYLGEIKKHLASPA